VCVCMYVCVCVCVCTVPLEFQEEPPLISADDVPASSILFGMYAFACDVSMVLQECSSDAIKLLQWCYSGVIMV
jgi:hypothetical protein